MRSTPAVAGNEYDRLCRLARTLLHAPAALILRADGAARELHRADALPLLWPPAGALSVLAAACRGAPAGPRSTAWEAPRGAGEPFADAGTPAGLHLPLTDRAGHTLGHLLVLDRVPRAWTAEQCAAADDVAAAVTARLELLAERERHCRTAHQLREAQQHYHALVARGADAVFTLDANGLLTAGNEACEPLCGYTPEEIHGTSFLWLVVEADREHVGHAIDAACAGEPHDVQFTIVHKSGERAELSVSALPVLARGTVAGAYLIARDVTAARQRERQLATVAILGSALRSAPTRSAMLPIILEQVLDIAGAAGAALALRNPETGAIHCALGEGEWAGWTGKPLDGSTHDVIASRTTYVACGAAVRLPVPEQLSPAPVGAVACAPLIADGEGIGALWLGRANPLGDEDIRLLVGIADLVSSAIHRATLHEETQQRLQRNIALNNINMAVSDSLQLDVVLNVILDQVTFHLEVDAADLLLWNPHNEQLEFAAGRGLPNAARRPPPLRLGQGLAGRAALSRLPLEQRRDAGTTSADQFAAQLAVPLLSKGDVVGVLEVFHSRPLERNAAWREFLESLAAQAAVALENAALFQRLEHQNRALAEAYDTTLEGWSRALELRDNDTEGHTQRVTELTLALARTAGIPAEHRIHVRRGALLHDIGKMGIPDSILLKPARLTEEEWKVMQLHPVYAHRWLKPIRFLEPALDIPFCHHERWDGTGYPRGLRGEEIPLAARLFAVVDVWDALCSDRPYRAAVPEADVRAYIRSLAGTHFDPAAVDAFERLMDSR